jgi:hypothetical protein
MNQSYRYSDESERVNCAFFFAIGEASAQVKILANRALLDLLIYSLVATLPS